MRYGWLGGTGLQVSRVVLGGVSWGETVDETEAVGIIGRALDAGVTAFDTAGVYGGGRSEEILGRAIAQVRDEVLVFSKVGLGAPGPGSARDRGGRDLSRRAVLDGAHRALRRLGTDRIDLFQVHCWDENTPIDETLSALDRLVAAGDVRYIGCSNYAGWQVQRALWRSEIGRWPSFVSVQAPYSMVERGIETELEPSCRDAGIGLLAYQVLAGGVLSGGYRIGEEPDPRSRLARRAYLRRDYWNESVFAIADELAGVSAELDVEPSGLAVRWVMERPGVSAVIVGVDEPAQLDAILAGIDRDVDPAVLAGLRTVEPERARGPLATPGAGSAPPGAGS